MSLKSDIEFLAKTTKMDNAEIALTLKCSERSVRRYAGEWKERLKKRFEKSGGEGERKALIIADIHKPYNDPSAYAIAINYGKEWKPDDLVILGDYADFKDVSFWKQNPIRSSFSEEVSIVRRGLQTLREDFPDSAITFVEGNHEERLGRYLWSKAPELYGLAELAVPKLLGLDVLNIEYVSNSQRLNNNQHPFNLGKLYLLHGHEIKLSWDGVNLARTMYLKTHCNVLFGHHHQSQHYIFKKLDGKHEGSWMAGCLCRLSEDYQPMNNWIHGFTTVKYNNETGYFKVRNKIIIDGQVL